jgi:diguanylate cyclase (GGDEF)-like protein
VSLRNRATGDLGLRTGLRDLTRRPFVLTFVALGTIELLRVILDPRPADLVVLVLVVLVGLLAVREREAVADTEGTRRTEAESFARILRALSRSVSPDAIVAAIVEELGVGTGADHVAVVRRRPESRVLEAVLSSTRPGAPTSRTSLPLGELEDPAEADALASLAMAASRGRRLTAVPIDPDPAGDPQLVPLGIAADRRVRAGGRGNDGLVAELEPAGVGVGVFGPAPLRPRRPSHAVPARDGAGQRIADQIATRMSDAYGLSNVLAAPLRVDGKTEGAIIVSRRTSEAWPASAQRILEAAATESSAALARVYSLREAEARAATDALTGLPNRRYFDEYLGLLARRRRAEDRVGVLMVDIDRFKKLNDTFGHAVGDHVLREVARAIAEAVREDDVPARFGGEEFAVLLRNPSPEVAVEVGERVRRAVAALDLRRLGVPGVSVSVGVAVAMTPDVTLDVVIDDADRALFRAKRAGRDRVVAA